jgi:hypothetical protein
MKGHGFEELGIFNQGQKVGDPTEKQLKPKGLGA